MAEGLGGLPPRPAEVTGAVDVEGTDAAALAGPAAPPGAPEPAPAAVSEEMVRALVTGLVGGSLNFLVHDRDVPEQWRFTDAELDDLVPPLTRVVNRRPDWAAAVARGDELVVASVLLRYGSRNVTDGRRAKKARSDEQHREIDPRQAGSGGPHPGPGAPNGSGSGPGGGPGVVDRLAPGGGVGQ